MREHKRQQLFDVVYDALHDCDMKGSYSNKRKAGYIVRIITKIIDAYFKTGLTKEEVDARINEKVNEYVK